MNGRKYCRALSHNFSLRRTIRKRTKEWGPAGFSERWGAAWSGFAPNLDQWIKVIQYRGPAAVQRAYLDTLNGRVPPDQGLILSLSE
jgi:hypothetical protein